jgi:hypothetical protein
VNFYIIYDYLLINLFSDFLVEMQRKILFLALFTGFILLIWISRLNTNQKNIQSSLSSLIFETNECTNYKRECNQLFKKLRYPNQSLIIRPPLKMPPPDLMKKFTQNGDMPITKEWYINEVYSDSNSNDKNSQATVTANEFSKWLNKVKNNEPLNYFNTEMQVIMKKYKDHLESQSLVVIGTQLPWIEAIGYALTASKITTLDYTRKKYETDRLEWLHVNDYLDDLISDKKQIEEFDNAASFSSIEHSGLGRYGDPLSPDGDIDAVRQVHCMLKPDGLFFLGLPASNDDSSYIEFNAHRFYGSKRLNVLFNGWNKIDQKKCHDIHTIYLLKKKSVC